MKLKETFVLRTVGAEQYLISVDQTVYSGILRLNSTAAFIAEQLTRQTDEAQIVEALCRHYEVDAQQAQAGVAAVLEKLRGCDALEE